MKFWMSKIFFGKNKFALARRVFQEKSFRYFREAIFLIRHPQNRDLLEIQDTPKSLFVDIGAFEGNFANLYIQKYPDSKMILIEPIDKFVESIRNKFSDDSVEIIQSALTADGRNLRLFVADANTSAIPQENAKVIEVPSISVADLSSMVRSKSITLLQINCEGAEYEILPEIIKSGLITQIEALNIQFHYLSLSNMLKHWKIRRELSRTHRLKWSTYFIWERWQKKTREEELRKNFEQ
jgi:FkbM family methyltransferase